MNNAPVQMDDQLDSIMGQVADEFLERLGHGQPPDVEEYVRRYPALATVLRQVLPALQAVREPACGPTGAGEFLAPASSPINNLGDFRIRQEIGRGGMGVVYEAEQISLGRRVALKILPLADTLDPRHLQRFQTEAHAAGCLHHPSIVPVYAVGCEQGVHYYAMPLIDGRDLAAWLAELRQSRLHPPASYFRTVAQLAVQVADALAHAHQLGVVHRDIKPANLLIDHSPLITHHSPQLWITDFGLAHIQSDARLTATGDVMGTVRYMSPEQAQPGRTPVDHRTDIYSLGATLYELLTLEPPFNGGNRHEVLLQVTLQEPITPRRRNQAIPVDLETIVLKAMAKRPEERYAAATELADDLQRFLADRPIRARRTSLAGHMRRWCRRNPLLAAVSGLALAAAVALGVVYAFAVQQAAFADTLRQKNQEIQTQKLKADEERDRAESLSATLAMERGLVQCEQGGAGLGLLSLAHSLSIVPDRRPDLARDIRVNLARWHRHVYPVQAFLPHSQGVKSLALSPDGGILVTAGQPEKCARLWRVATGQLIRELPLDAALSALAFSPSGKTLATASAVGTVRLWEAKTGQAIGAVGKHQGIVLELVFWPDGRALATASFDGTARLWDAARLKPLATMQHDSKVLAAAFHPGGRALATAGVDRTVRLWDAATGKPIGQALRHEATVIRLAFSPDGSRILTVSQDYAARLWDARSGAPIGKPLQHDHVIYAIAFSPDGKIAATASNDRTARLWDAATGQPIGPPLEHFGSVRMVAFRPDGKRVITADNEGTARIWEATTGKPVGNPLRHQGPLKGVAFSPDGKTVATASWDGTARLWDTDTGLPNGSPMRHPNNVAALTFTPNSKRLVTACADGVRFWVVDRGRIPGLPLYHPAPVSAVALSPDGKLVASGCGDLRSGEARLWEAATGKLLRTLPHGREVRAVAFSPDRRTLATASEDHTTRLWEIATGQLIRTLQHPAGVWSLAFHPRGNLLATSGADRAVRLWEPATGKARILLQDRQRKEVMSFSPDGKTLLLNVGATAMIYDVASGQHVAGPLRNDFTWTYAARFSADGKTLVTGGGNGTACLWQVAGLRPFEFDEANLARNKPFATLRHAHRAPVAGLALSEDGKVLVTAGYDGTARLWETPSGKPRGSPMRQPNWIVAVALSPDGKTLVTGSPDGTARLWEIPGPTKGDTERIRLWVQVMTNLELDEAGQERVLDGPTWQKRRQRLETMGGPPVPLTGLR
jgi:WD40 repeat protein